MYYIIAYDTPSDKRRRKLMNLLKDYLAHVQKSVFEGHLPQTKYNELQKKISSLMNPGSDSVRVYSMPLSSWQKTTVVGLPPLTIPESVIIVTDPISETNFPINSLQNSQ